jgi:TPR repeat protein
VSLADGGNRRAACQLGSLLSQCALVHPSMLTEQYQDQLRQSEADLSARGELDEANEVARMMLQARTLRQQCGGIPPSLRHRAPAYLRQAALAGEPEAMVRYLRGEAFQGAGAVDSSDLIGPDFDRWRREAPVMLQAALRSGRPEAALLLLEAHSHESTTLSLVTPVNPLLDQAYLRLAQRLFEDFQMPEYWEADEADTELAREADALARQWQRQHFQDRRFSISKDLVGLGHALLPDGESLWPAPEQWRPACAETTEPSP